jgi:hypothetical protein
MKKLFAAIFALAVSAGQSFSQEVPANAVLVSNGHFHHLNIADNIDVELFESNDKGDAIMTPAGTEGKLKVVRSGDIAYLKFNGRNRTNERVKVYVNATHLQTVTVSGNCTVNSQHILNSEDLTVHMAGEGHVSLKSRKNINVVAVDDFEVKYLRRAVTFN